MVRSVVWGNPIFQIKFTRHSYPRRDGEREERRSENGPLARGVAGQANGKPLLAVCGERFIRRFLIRL
jgi:hypothetical protein